MKYIFSLLIILSIISCSKEKDVGYTTKISGYHKVVSIHSDVGIDMNNDGIKSQDVLLEIAGPHNTVDEKKLSFLDFDSPKYYLQIRPLPETTNNAKLIAFNFPSQYIGFLSDGKPFLMHYQPSFINYSYELNQGSQVIKLINNIPISNEKGSLESFKMLSNNELELSLTKQIFDFVELDWVEAKLVVKYKKVK